MTTPKPAPADALLDALLQRPNRVWKSPNGNGTLELSRGIVVDPIELRTLAASAQPPETRAWLYSDKTGREVVHLQRWNPVLVEPAGVTETPLVAASAQVREAEPLPDEAREPAPANSLPTWFDCRHIIENHEFRQRAAAGLEGPVLDTAPNTPEPTALHRFIHEYDDADPYRSEWFLHRLELVVQEAKAKPAAEPVPQCLVSSFLCQDYPNCQCARKAEPVSATINSSEIDSKLIGEPVPVAQVVLTRWGLAHTPSVVLEQMPDGYWTPWHIANEAIADHARRVESLEAALADGVSAAWHNEKMDEASAEIGRYMMANNTLATSLAACRADAERLDFVLEQLGAGEAAALFADKEQTPEAVRAAIDKLRQEAPHAE